MLSALPIYQGKLRTAKLAPSLIACHCSEYGITNTVPDLLNAPYLSIINDVQEALQSGKNSQQVFIDRMDREWGYMRADRTCLGGAYFPWLSCGSGNNPWGWVRWGEDAEWGVITADLLPKAEFWALRVAFSPVYFPAKVHWQQGNDYFEIEIENQFHGINLHECTLRTQQSGGHAWMGIMRPFQDVPIACAPGERCVVRIPIWEDDMISALKSGGFGCCRFHLLRPDGFRIITADTLVLPAEVTQSLDSAMPIGPDAPM